MKKIKAFGIDQGASRDVGVLFLPEVAKTLSNGSCPGHHNGVVQAIRGGGQLMRRWVRHMFGTIKRTLSPEEITSNRRR